MRLNDEWSEIRVFEEEKMIKDLQSREKEDVTWSSLSISTIIWRQVLHMKEWPYIDIVDEDNEWNIPQKSTSNGIESKIDIYEILKDIIWNIKTFNSIKSITSDDRCLKLKWRKSLNWRMKNWENESNSVIENSPIVLSIWMFITFAFAR